MIKISKARRQIETHKKLRSDRKERLQKHNAKLAMLRALLEEYERQERWHELTPIKVRIRTVEQQIRYMRPEVP